MYIYIYIINEILTVSAALKTQTVTQLFIQNIQKHIRIKAVCTTCMKHLIEYQIFTHYELYHMGSNRHETSNYRSINIQMLATCWR